MALFLNLSPWWQLLLLGTSLYLLKLGWSKSRHGQFYSDTFILLPLGIYVWGDALILAPFWAISALAFMFLPPIWVIRWVCLFFTLRSAYEIIYWINHQVADRSYMPPLFKSLEWMKPLDAAILYQLLHMCQLLIWLVLLIFTFSQ